MRDAAISLVLCNKTGFDFKRKTVAFSYLAARCRNAQCPLGVFGCPFGDDENCREVTAEMWEDYFWPYFDYCDEGEDDGRADS